MGKQYSGGWEGRSHFVFVAQWYDPDYDPDCDVQPRVWLAWELCGRNVETSISYLLNQWDRSVRPMAWDLAEAFMDIPFASINYFDDAAREFLESIEYLDPKLSMEGAKDQRDYKFEQIGA
jgi:hypothetical protein